MAVDYPDYTIDLANEPWEFDILGVWKREDGFYLSTDSGCSCPTPWENHTEDDLTGPLSWEQTKEELRSLAAISYDHEFAEREVEDFIKEYESGL